MGSHKSVILGSGVPSGGSGPGANQFPAVLGQETMADSFAVVIASDQSAVPVSDGGGSLTVDSLQLPITLGAQTAATSLSVVKATEVVTDNATYVVNGNMGGDINMPNITIGPEGRVTGFFSWPSTSSPIGRITLDLRAPDASTFDEVPGAPTAFRNQPTAGAAGTTFALFEGFIPGSVVRFRYIRTSGGTTNSLQGQTRVS